MKHPCLTILLTFCLLLTVRPATAQDAQAPQEPPALIRVGTIEQKQTQIRWDVVGRLIERKRSIIAAEQNGRIIELDVEEGDTVVAGKTVLAKIDPVWAKLSVDAAQAQLDQAKAMLEQAKAQLQQEERDLSFYNDLATKNSARPKEVDDAKTAVDIARAELANAQASLAQRQVSLELAKEELARLEVKAPFDGVVVRKHTELGQWVNQGNSIVEIISTGQIKAEVHVPESLINNMVTGSGIPLKIDPLNMETQGKISAIIPDGSSAARTFPVHILLENPEGALKVGMSVTAHIPTSKAKNFLTVPRNAILTSSQGSVVWVNMQGKAMPVEVKILFGIEDRYVIEPKPPLQAGMQAVIEGAERLRPTQAVQVIP
ncbi:MAG: efflux RND transporter periplasmic adaptor subunit [Phycisphaeraceae bacterium JB051]